MIYTLITVSLWNVWMLFITCLESFHGFIAPLWLICLPLPASLGMYTMYAIFKTIFDEPEGYERELDK